MLVIAIVKNIENLIHSQSAWLSGVLHDQQTALIHHTQRSQKSRQKLPASQEHTWIGARCALFKTRRNIAADVLDNGCLSEISPPLSGNMFIEVPLGFHVLHHDGNDALKCSCWGTFFSTENWVWPKHSFELTSQLGHLAIVFSRAWPNSARS